MSRKALTGADLLRQIRSRHAKRLLSACILLAAFTVLTVLLSLRFGAAGLLCLLPAVICAGAAGCSLMHMMHPERSAVFRKYGSPDSVAEMISADSGEVFYENRRLLVTQRWLMEKGKPESLMRFEWILLVYERHSGLFPLPRGQFVAAHDCWDTRCIYPFAVGEQQVFKPEILLDKIKKNAPGCKIGCSAQHRAYAKAHRRSLPRPEERE